MKTTIFEMKNILDGINNWGDRTEEEIIQLESTAIETQSKMKCREKKEF